MTAEKLHEAITQLPGDLITAADRVRSAPRKSNARRTRWISLAASVAACFALVILCALALRSMSGMTKYTADTAAANGAIPAEAACEEPEMELQEESGTGADSSAAADTTGALPDDSKRDSGSTSVLTFAEAFPTPAYGEGAHEIRVTVIRSREELEEYCAQMRGAFDLSALISGYRGYDDSYFAENDLLLVFLEETACPQALSLTRAEDNTWALSVGAGSAEAGQDTEPAQWHLLAGIQKDLIGPEDTVTVHWEEEP